MRALNRFAITITGLLVVVASVCVLPQRGQSQEDKALDSRAAASTSAPLVQPPPGGPTLSQQPKGIVVAPSGVVHYTTRSIPVTMPGEGGEYTVHGLAVEITLDDKTREVLSKYPDAAEADRPALIEKLTTVVTEQFDQRQAAREQELAQLEQQVKKLRALHDQRAKEKKEIVQDRVKQLLRDASGLGWGSNDPANAGNANVFYGKPGDLNVRSTPYGVREVLPARK